MESRVRNALTSVRHRASEGASGHQRKFLLYTTAEVKNPTSSVPRNLEDTNYVPGPEQRYFLKTIEFRDEKYKSERNSR